MAVMDPGPRRPSAREAVRLGGDTWRMMASLVGDPCSDCGVCAHGATDHESHRCRLTPGWFCGSTSLCAPCFSGRVRQELSHVDLTGIVERAAYGDDDALGRLRDAAG